MKFKYKVLKHEEIEQNWFLRINIRLKHKYGKDLDVSC
jgi:hypothetical protein